VLLAVGAGLLVRSLTEIQRVDPGFSRGQITVLQVFAWDRQTTPEKRATFFKSVLDELRAEPGVKAVGAVTAMPFIEANIAIRSPISIVGQAPPAPGDDALIFTTVVAGDYFDAMGIPLDRGRLFDTRDGSASRPVAVITRSAARKYWPAADPIGAHATIRFAGKPSEVEIVGIVGDALHDALDRPARREMFLPHAQSPYGSMTFVVRAQESTQVSLQSLKQRVWAVDPLQAFYRTATMEELVARTLVGRRFNVLLLAGFGVIALLLAAAGLYGVMSFSTARRAREFGVRIALGAKASDILRLVVTEGVRLTTIGIAAGLVAAFWLTRLLRGLLFHVGQTDPGTFGAVALLLLTVALVSSAVPAWRAIRSDPLTSLKAE
jgi:putative ABC transport system permease protein